MSLKTKPAAILPVIVGTAGHVDHGKSALVKLLTGCEMDRHPEARARGLTIDLGFAPCRLPGNRMVGIVDVPGHEDFIRNMVAGAASIDVLMLIIAADDGVMPQTREHLQIVRLLRTARVMVVVTKIDLVEPEMRELVMEDVTAFMHASGFPDAPVLMASNITFEGIDAVRKKLVEIVEQVERRPDPRAFRLNVERVFSVKGYGTVVTGIPVSGRVPVGGTVELLPQGTSHVMRAVQTYKQNAEAAIAGACAALNLRDLETEDVRRGMSVALPGVYRAVSGMIVWMKNEHAGLALKRISRVKFHAGTAAVNASVKLIDRELLKPGDEAFAHLRLEHPLLLAAGDRYVVRYLSPMTTLGGGLILSVRDYKFKRSNPHLPGRLRAALAAVQRGDVLEAELLAGPSAITTRAEALRLTQCEGASAQESLNRAIGNNVMTDLGGDGLLVAARADELAGRFARILKHYHDAHPYQWGMAPDLVCRELGLAPACFKKLSLALVRDGCMHVRHGRLSLADFEPPLSGQQIKWREQILERVMQAGIKAPARGDLMKEFGIPAKEMRLLLRLLAEENLVMQVGNNLISMQVMDECREKVVELFQAKDMIELSDFRRVTGVGRNLAVALLEEFDNQGLTRRVAGGRVLS